MVEERLPREARFVVWRVLADFELWTAERWPDLFWPRGIGFVRSLYPDELGNALKALEAIWISPHLVDEGRMAGACEEIWLWAEAREHLEIALQFAELAARLEPDRADRASTAGRLARRRGEFARGTVWFARALRQATRDKDLINKAIARLGWSALELELGNLGPAIHHATKAFRAAMRAGRRSLAASASHDLMACYIHQERYEEALMHSRSAVAMYKLDHPRFPGLAHDVAVLWSRLGYHSSALVVFQMILANMQRVEDHTTALANVARSAAACRDRVSYQRAMGEALEAAKTKAPIRPSTYYHLAWAARTYEDWTLAEKLAKTYLARCPDTHKPRARKLLDEIRERRPGEVDIIPDPGSELEQSRTTLLRKLRRRAASGPDEATPPPERYPLG